MTAELKIDLAFGEGANRKVLQLVGDEVWITDMTNFPAELHDVKITRKEFHILEEFIGECREVFRANGDFYGDYERTA